MSETVGQGGRPDDMARLIGNIARAFEPQTVTTPPEAPTVDHASTTRTPEILSAKPDRDWRDEIGPEGFMRAMLDRSFREINRYFVDALGTENAPLQASINALERTGRVDLLDVGCGTGNTLRTWAEILPKLTSCKPGDIECTGISLHDYSGESAYPRTRQACATGGIRYIRGNAQNMRAIDPNSSDVVLSHAAIIHTDRPELWLNGMLRAARPDAVIFFTIKDEQNFSDRPIMERLFHLEDKGHSLMVEPVVHRTTTGVPFTQVYCRLQLNPEARR